MGLGDQAHHLLERQQRDWGLLRENYQSLANARIRSFEFDGFTVKVQCNPGRITSSSAPVDEDSIRRRPCFLCRQNRPTEQRELPLHDDLVLLCNPYPIFPEHFTIPTLSHIPQRIADNFARMLELARDLHPRYMVLYNGPRCGASAPDHLHFQAGTCGSMPIDNEYASLPKTILVDRAELRVRAVYSYMRHFIALESHERNALINAFDRVYSALVRITAEAGEPMMNLHASFQSGAWRVIVFPRGRHRPSFYLAEGDERILLSPAAVDLGGVCITPLQRDFERLTRDDLVKMFEEVTLPKDAFDRLSAEIRSDLAAAS